jgi:hypothetical protein
MNIGDPLRTVELPDEEPMHFPEPAREPEKVEPVKVPEREPVPAR